MKAFVSWCAAHAKLLAAVAGAALTIAIQVWGTGNHWVALAILAATCLGVYQAPNKTAAGVSHTPAGTGPVTSPPAPVRPVPAAGSPPAQAPPVRPASPAGTGPSITGTSGPVWPNTNTTGTFGTPPSAVPPYPPGA